MRRQDKFGRRIYSNIVWDRMLDTGQKLTALGYQESRKKPNLFYNKIEHGVFFADLRGTEEVPIWDDQRPLFYWQLNETLPAWKCRRLIKEELIRLGARGGKCRLSFEFFNHPLFENTSAYVDEENLIFDWNDGLCRTCGKDFEGEGAFCSNECELENQLKNMKEEQKLIKCGVCGRHPEIILENGEYVFKDSFVEHHTNYEKNITVKVCQSCNIKIGKNPEKYPKFLVPEQPRKNFVKARKRRKYAVRHLILITLMNRKHCLEPELITEVAQKSDVKEATVKRELGKLLRNKLVEMTYKILPRNGRAPVYSLVQAKKTRRKVKPNNGHGQRALSEYN